MNGQGAGPALPAWPGRDWLVSPPALRLAAALLLAVAGLAGFIAHEGLNLGWPLGREEAARFDAYHLVRSLFAATAAGFVVAAVTAARAPDCALNRTRLATGPALVGVLAMASALAAAGLLAASPRAFHAIAQEDTALEWASALLLLGASGLLALHFARELARRRSPAVLLPAGLLAAGFFVLGMEEISWLQRVIGFATPARLADVNWQAEFNLHNLQTDLSELIFYAGAVLFLGVLPLLRDAIPAARARHPLAGFMPGRGVAAAAAPGAAFTFGQWNLLPVQFASWLALLALVAFAISAKRRGDGCEALLFSMLAAAVAAGQALVLANGPLMVDLPDASEYKELFIALGFACYAAGVAGRAEFLKRSNPRFTVQADPV